MALTPIEKGGKSEKNDKTQEIISDQERKDRGVVFRSPVSQIKELWGEVSILRT